MIDLLVSFSWATDTKGFHIPGNVDLNLRDRIPVPFDERIVRNGGTLQKYLPAKIEALFDDFLHVHTPGDLLRFTNRYGPLTRDGFYCEASDDDFSPPNEFQVRFDEGEALDLGLENSGWFRDVLKEKNRPSRVARSFEAFQLQKYQTEIVPDTKHGIRFRFFPESLLDYLILRLAHVVLALPAYSPCLMCGKFFTKGVGTRRRGDAQFCCDKHRIDYNSQKRTRSPKNVLTRD
jgi:hypothetical protein